MNKIEEKFRKAEEGLEERSLSDSQRRAIFARLKSTMSQRATSNAAVDTRIAKRNTDIRAAKVAAAPASNLRHKAEKEYRAQDKRLSAVYSRVRMKNALNKYREKLTQSIASGTDPHKIKKPFFMR